MIAGAVHADGDPIVPIRIRGTRGGTINLDAVVDTGFNGWLTLSAHKIAALGLRFREEGRYVLAYGSETVSRLFEAEAEWLGGWRPFLILEMEGGPLLGMAAMRGSYLGIEVMDGDRVEIRRLDA